jgi:hypothetical protein
LIPFVFREDTTPIEKQKHQPSIDRHSLRRVPLPLRLVNHAKEHFLPGRPLIEDWRGREWGKIETIETLEEDVSLADLRSGLGRDLDAGEGEEEADETDDDSWMNEGRGVEAREGLPAGCGDKIEEVREMGRNGLEDWMLDEWLKQLEAGWAEEGPANEATVEAESVDDRVNWGFEVGNKESHPGSKLSEEGLYAIDVLRIDMRADAGPLPSGWELICGLLLRARSVSSDGASVNSRLPFLESTLLFLLCLLFLLLLPFRELAIGKGDGDVLGDDGRGEARVGREERSDFDEQVPAGRSEILKGLLEEGLLHPGIGDGAGAGLEVFGKEVGGRSVKDG